MTRPIRLIILDAGHTAGTFGPPGTDELLCRVSPLLPHRVKEEARRFLHTNPYPSDEVIMGLCGALLIKPEELPRNWHEGSFTAYPYAVDAITEMTAATDAKVVVLSNIPCTTGPARMRALNAQLPVVDRIYTSYEMGMRKPDIRCWQWISAQHKVDPDQCVHIGDQWTNDIMGAVFAGCRAVYVDTRGYPPPLREEWPAGPERIGVAKDLRGAAAVVRCWQQEAAA